MSGTTQAAIDCSVSTSGVGFGDYDPLLATPDDSSANVAVTCTRVILVDPFTINYTLSLSRGSSVTALASPWPLVGSVEGGYALAYTC